ncbi:unnamed protein product [Cladocopium goreaui]|uniref:SbsA Ig-like domain-containing protein n=1 Tax=Cladocopium goreaui TaxID=2562237 RepID=A0A9P1GJP7_9DINO|nr:unnamed protein product [Cladocopium goreaui]
MFVMKLDSLGAHQWTILRGGSSVEEARGLQVDASGNVFVAGYTASTDLDSQSNAGDFDVFVMKFDSDGAHQWTILRGGSGDDFAYGLQVDASGNVFVAGFTASTDLDSQSNAGNTDVFVMKFDSDGAHQWTILRGGPGDEFAYGLQVDASGNVFVAGYTASTDLDNQSNAGDFDVFVMKFDSDGAHQWTILRGDSGDDFANGLQARCATTPSDVVLDVKFFDRVDEEAALSFTIGRPLILW